MATIGNTISSDLAAQIQLLSAIKDDSNLSAADKEAKLKQEGAKTLNMIANEKDSLSIVNLAFTSNIQDVIQAALASDDWDGIPPPTEMKRNIADLQQVSQALAVCLNQAFNDVDAIMKLLIDISAKFGTMKATEWLQHMKNSMESAKEQFKNTEESIKSQKKADQTAAIGQIVGGSLSCAMSAGSMIGSAVNAKKQLKALEKQKDIHILKESLDSLGEKSKKMTKNVGKEKAEFERIKTDKSMSDNQIKDQEVKFKNEEKLQIRIDKEYKDAKSSYKAVSHEADKINILNKTEADQITMINGISSGVNSLTNGIAGLRSADEKAEASTSKLEADKKEYQKSLEQNMTQTTLDQLQKSGQFIDKVLQAKSSMEQSKSGQISASIRA